APELEEQGLVALAARVYATGEPFRASELTATLTLPDGQSREGYFSCVMHPLRDASGRIDGVIAFAFEMTAQVSARKLEQIARERAERAVTMLTSLHAVTTSLARAITAAEAAEVIIDEGI